MISAFAIWFLLERHRRTRGPVAALVVVVLALGNFFFFYRIVGTRPAAGNARDAILSRVIYYPDESRSAILTLLHDNGVRRGRLLVPQEYLPTIHYYFSAVDLLGYRASAETNEKRNKQIIERLASGNIDGLVYEGTDYATLGNFLEQKWLVRSSRKLEARRPGAAFAYYQLNTRNSPGAGSASWHP